MNWLKRQFKFDYYGMNIDEFHAWSQKLYGLGISVSAVPSEYGQGTCLGCRCMVALGPHEWALEYARKHRGACGGRMNT
jgi:hypothetical protein